MAISACIKIGTIPGESAIKGHLEEIDVLSWNWGLTQSASSHVGSGAGSGSADVKDLRITKYVDKATPNLLQSCFKGADQKTATLTVIKVGGAAPVEFVKIKMEGTVFISSVTTGDPLPDLDRFTETVTLNFSKATFTYTTQKADQTAGPAVDGVLEIASQY
jgi:type VI secretion system secreted protein Hcp